MEMDMPKAIIIAATIISIGNIVSSGFFSFSSDSVGVANRYNKFTGSVSMCSWGEGCESFTVKPDAKPISADEDLSKPLDKSKSNK
jgi:hypothetical protein